MLYLLTLIFALFDRMSGGGVVKLPGREFLYLPLAVVPLGLLAGLSPLVIGTLCVAFIAWRSPGWKVFGGKLDPRTPREVAGMVARHGLALLFLVPVILHHNETGAPLVPLSFAVAAFPLLAAGLARWLASQYDKGVDRNHEAELARGAILGLLVAVSLTN